MNEKQAQENLRRDQEYLSPFFDPQNLGELLGHGFQRRVYALKTPFSQKPPVEMVVKISRTEYIFPATTLGGTLNALDVGMEYFSEYAVSPTLLLSQGERYILLQRRLGQFDYLNPQNIDQVKVEVEDVFKRQHQLLRDGMYMSMLGFEGIKMALNALINPVVTPKMTNLVIEQTESGSRLCIPDFTIYNLKMTSFNPRNLLTYLMYNSYFMVNEWLIGHYFGSLK